MKNKTNPIDSETGDNGASPIQPLAVSDELISRIAGKCEEIFPLKNRFQEEGISDEGILEMESLLKRFQPAPVKFLFREQCCTLMCAESEREMESRLKKLSAAPLTDFSVFRMAQEMKDVNKRDKASGDHQKSSIWRRLIYFSGFSAAAALVAVFLIQDENGMIQPASSTDGGVSGAEIVQEKENPSPSIKPGEKEKLFRPATPFELQGGDERIPVMAPATPSTCPGIQKILPGKKY